MESPQPYQLVRRTHQAATYEIWEAQSVSGETAMLVILTTPEPAARDTFGEVVRRAVRGDLIDVKVAASDLAGSAPWVALVPDRLGRGVYRFIDQLQLADRAKVWPARSPTCSPATPSRDRRAAADR